MSFESKPPSIGLWKNDRGPHASGNCGGIRFVLWENTDCDGNQNGNQPEYRLVLEAPQRREERAEQTAGQREAMHDDEVPF